MKIIYIKEDRIPEFKFLLDESEDKLPFFDFFREIKKFIVDLLEDPIDAKPGHKLAIRGFTSGKLRKLLRDANVITMKERIDEPRSEETGEIESRYYLSYKVPKKDFKKKVKRLYQKLFESDITESYNMRDQIKTALDSPLTMGFISDESQPEYVKDAIKIYNDKIIDKKLHNNEKES
jgi:hypothetical protein